MKAVFSIASLLVCAFSSNAQITATLRPLPDGSADIRIRNDSAVGLTAYAIRVNETNRVTDGPLIVYVDSLIDEAATPVSPSQEHVFKEGRHFVERYGEVLYAVFERPIVTAGIFADGTTIGDATLLTGLTLRRRNMVQATELAIEMLSDAGQHNVRREQLIGQFKRMADSLNRWYLPPELQVGHTVYQSIVGKLVNLPEVPVGSPFPPSDFVSRETTMLNRQRVTLLESQPSLAEAALIRK